MTADAYVQPIAGHTSSPHHLIVRDTRDRWFLWLGCDTAGLTEIPAATALWMRQRPEIEDFPLPRFWYPPESLPLSDVAHS